MTPNSDFASQWKRRWFRFKLRHPWARNLRAQAAHRRLAHRLAAAQELAQRNEISVGQAIDELYGPQPSLEDDVSARLLADQRDKDNDAGPYWGPWGGWSP